MVEDKVPTSFFGTVGFSPRRDGRYLSLLLYFSFPSIQWCNSALHNSFPGAAGMSEQSDRKLPFCETGLTSDTTVTSFPTNISFGTSPSISSWLSLSLGICCLFFRGKLLLRRPSPNSSSYSLLLVLGRVLRVLLLKCDG